MVDLCQRACSMFGQNNHLKNSETGKYRLVEKF